MNREELSAVVYKAMRDRKDMGHADASYLSNIAVSTLLPLVEADLREKLTEEVGMMRIVCPVHKIPDCSPLLNGCSVPNWLHDVKDAASLIVLGKTDG
jgi:hypothetical protein